MQRSMLYIHLGTLFTIITAHILADTKSTQQMHVLCQSVEQKNRMHESPSLIECQNQKSFPRKKRIHMSDHIGLIEEKLHSIVNSMLIGDFNVDPFEMPMISFSGMSATNGLACSRREEVTRAGEKTKLFYNPMWTLYSPYKDRPGSHRYSRLGEDVVSWHFLDQVIIRPTLIDSFKFESLKLINGTENYNYLNRNQTPYLSDHLPLMCEIVF